MQEKNTDKYGNIRKRFPFTETREIGEFEQCVQYLDSIEPVTGYENEVREQIRKRALDGDRMVFQLG